MTLIYFQHIISSFIYLRQVVLFTFLRLTLKHSRLFCFFPSFVPSLVTRDAGMTGCNWKRKRTRRHWWLEIPLSAFLLLCLSREPQICRSDWLLFPNFCLKNLLFLSSCLYFWSLKFLITPTSLLFYILSLLLLFTSCLPFLVTPAAAVPPPPPSPPSPPLLPPPLTVHLIHNLLPIHFSFSSVSFH